MVVDLHRLDPSPHLPHHASTFMPQHGGENAFRVGPGKGVGIGVTNSCGFDLNQDFARFGAFQVQGFNGQWRSGLQSHCCTCFHEWVSFEDILCRRPQSNRPKCMAIRPTRKPV